MQNYPVLKFTKWQFQGVHSSQLSSGFKEEASLEWIKNSLEVTLQQATSFINGLFLLTLGYKFAPHLLHVTLIQSLFHLEIMAQSIF